MILNIYVDDDTLARLQLISKQLDRNIEELAETSVSEAPLQYFNRKPNEDPARNANK